MNITEIEILGLFGEIDIRLPIKNNRIIIVGYNGLGKSTILNIFYYIISQQWNKLYKQDFKSVSLKISGRRKYLKIEKSDIETFLDFRSRRRRMHTRHRLSSRLQKDIYKYIQLQSNGREPHKYRTRTERNYRPIKDISEQFGLPLIVAEDVYRSYLMAYREGEVFEEENDVVSEVDSFIEENRQGRILYLPTYRRIERDLKEVFPDIEEELQSKLLRRREGSQDQTYIELVHFGMEDVAYKIRSRLENIRTYALEQVNNLTARYLRDVIRNEASNYSAIESGLIDGKAISTVFTKVDNSILNEEDKYKLDDVVKKINGKIELRENEKYVAHYVMYLVEIGKNISQLEAPILRFAEVCNSYLYGKMFEFDNIGYKLIIRRDSGKPVELENLSSGEKQIVSLFSHLLLDDQTANYIFIDEPELSLSVDWQQRLLSDISNLPSCKFIAAVTHSPFIFENELDDHTVDLLQSTSAAK